MGRGEGEGWNFFPGFSLLPFTLLLSPLFRGGGESAYLLKFFRGGVEERDWV